MNEILIFFFFLTGCVNGEEKTTRPPVNRGAARQMYGNGRSISSRTTPVPELKKSTDTKNHITNKKTKNDAGKIFFFLITFNLEQTKKNLTISNEFSF